MDLVHFTVHFTFGHFAFIVCSMTSIVDPFVAALPSEVPLKDAPLVRVIAQFRFPEILSVEQRDFVAPFQEAIRRTYSVLRQEQTQGILLSPGGAAPAKPQIAWRFSDTEGFWRVSLTPEFLALETTKYVSRSDFFGRLKSLAEALDEHIEPGQLDRLGVRYIDRITGDAVDDIAKLVRPEVRGITGTIAATHAVHALSESMFELPEARVLARWGCLPPGATVDPAAIEPENEKSWILDLDMFSAAPMPFIVEDVVAEAQRYAERIYTVFRWAVTDDFLVRYGGKP
ncbi:TIGR04255 family protein [Accumulibacter sp.]|uniref:TIGR04255 family protein n=1 Tax=Accumulibacter sp. TaxID=2053492 RepID=UPI00262FBDF9|nr:TIGR04255 family protein [Accumulibacter sp.]